jgi:hypothetical protein
MIGAISRHAAYIFRGLGTRGITSAPLRPETRQRVRVKKTGERMLRDYRDWLEAEVRRLQATDEDAPEIDAAEMARLARDRLEAEMSKAICVELPATLARRILTSLEVLDQQTTSLRPEFATLREAIKTAFDLAIYPAEQDREPLEREFF